MPVWVPGDIEWGSYDHGMRVGIKVDVEDQIGHGETGCNFQATYYTQNNAKVNSDAQVLNLSGAIDGQISYTNDQGTGIIQRGGTRSYNYPYGANEYGSSPGTKTFSAQVGGSNAGSTASKSNSARISARPYGLPAPVSWQSASSTDTLATLQWFNNTSVGEPYQNVYVDRYIYPYGSYGGQDWTRVANWGALSSWSTMNSGVTPNLAFVYRIFAANEIGNGTAAQTNIVWTTPGAPANLVRTTAGTTQQLTWTRTVRYSGYKTEIYVSVNGGAWSLLFTDTTVGGPGTAASHNHTGTSVANKYRYQLRTVATETIGVASDFVVSDESSGTTTAPSAPTNLAPAADLSVDPKVDQVLSWTYNTTDGSTQTKYDIQHRPVGSSTWFTGDLGSQDPTRASWTMPKETYDYTEHIEWQVRTYGVNPALPSAWSQAQFWTMDEIPVKYPLVINLSTGRVEALSGGGAAGVGDANAVYYEQNYTVATASVGYAHGLGTKGLEIEFYDTTGVQRFGDVTKTPDTITMTFGHPLTGLMIVYGAVAA